jgi:hypothetical protein
MTDKGVMKAPQESPCIRCPWNEDEDSGRKCSPSWVKGSGQVMLYLIHVPWQRQRIWSCLLIRIFAMSICLYTNNVISVHGLSKRPFQHVELVHSENRLESRGKREWALNLVLGNIAWHVENGLNRYVTRTSSAGLRFL